jgi:chromate transport protein ChrA
MKWFFTEKMTFGSFGGPPVFILIILIIMVYTLVKLYRDANSRGKSGIVAILFILICGWPFSFIWWWWLRPKKKLIDENPN